MFLLGLAVNFLADSSDLIVILQLIELCKFI